MECAVEVGCKVFVLKVMDNESFWRQAEVLAVRSSAETEFYVHYVNFNKRLDEWVTLDRINLDKIEAPKKVAKIQIKEKEKSIKAPILSAAAATPNRNLATKQETPNHHNHGPLLDSNVKRSREDEVEDVPGILAWHQLLIFKSFLLIWVLWNAHFIKWNWHRFIRWLTFSNYRLSRA